jgi:hypothetical protein
LAVGSEFTELGVVDRDRGRPSIPLTGADIELSDIIDDGGFVLRLIVSESAQTAYGIGRGTMELPAFPLRSRSGDADLDDCSLGFFATVCSSSNKVSNT